MLKRYLTGYLLSLACTLVAFGLAYLHLATRHAFPTHGYLLLSFILVALLQLIAQLVFFLRVGKDTKPWDRFLLAFALLVVVLFVGGSLWIMANLRHVGETYHNGILTPQTELD